MGMCTSKVASLKQELFRVGEKMEFEERITNVRAKKESGLSFLQYTLEILQTQPQNDASSDAVLFLSMFIVSLPDRPLRISLHERLLTVKRQLDEGGIERKMSEQESSNTETGTRQNISIKMSAAKPAQRVA